MGVTGRLTKRSQYLAAARGRKWNSPHFLLQICPRAETPQAPARFGFTVTKKAGNAVVRNRIRRRLKEVVRRVAGADARPGHDYVLIARGSALKAHFETLIEDLSRGLRQHGERRRDRRGASQDTVGPGAAAGETTESVDER